MPTLPPDYGIDENQLDQNADYAWSRPGGLIERPGQMSDEPEAWLYCDRFSYSTHEKVSLKTHTTASTYEIEVIKDGLEPRTVYLEHDLPGRQHATPKDAYAVGCDWPEALSIQLDESWQPGFYLVVIRIKTSRGRPFEREGFFIVKPGEQQASEADFLLIHATSTMLAYNDWGGANHYRGIEDGYQNDIPSPQSSTQRPIARGMLRIPTNAPRESIGDAIIGPNWTPRYASLEYSWYFRYSRHYADAGWATYERPFVVWAENQGYKIHHITQSDLHSDARCLEGYKCAVSVGHDEYWSWEMRDHMDSFTEQGGCFARFGGNFCWQVRFDQNMHTQTCYKDPTADPATKTNPTRCSTGWDFPPVNRPAAQTVGLTGFGGVYTRFGVAAPRSSGGFQVYRPAHWALEGTELFYGDMFGAHPVNICGFEVDGVDYTFRKGLPYPTGTDGASLDLEIVAMCPAVHGERDRWGGREPIGGPLREARGLFKVVFPDGPPEYLVDREYGSGMVASVAKGQGQIFCAGTAEWVVGLIKKDFFTQKITTNVLDRFSGRQ
ncbi:hypothetical protein PV08_02523 [Exophiala spinifera]|uniref:N,N-dimethylformamidase beta subunit-like C-terminal domain-containing protein n=1 Tax=Exophiala spinifera TaxID=91928 RepID=A0A0D2BHW0_9EURO|nr:uncharacterized protein PV08_02523 [Exophiala spinifera]KIW18235.1 hypothetical protein PV08_02523 [Exophiala spinifera]